jgi:alpha-glucosidase
MLAILQAAGQSGTLYVYQGEEIGMANVPKSWGIEEYKDIATIQYWDKCGLHVLNIFSFSHLVI